LTTPTTLSEDVVSLQPRAPDLTFKDEIIAQTPGDSRLEMCIQCGTCGGSCPSGPDMEHSPRMIFAMISAGMKDKVLTSNTPWYCVSCYYCMERCPQEIHITDIMYTLKRMAIKEGKYQESSAADAPDLSKTYIDFVENYGRSFELGLATRYHLRHHPIDAFKMAGSLGLGMFLRGRMDLTPNRIDGINQLQSILAKAKQLGGAQ
jgi:heterodisulfide reductase subunit C